MPYCLKAHINNNNAQLQNWTTSEKLNLVRFNRHMPKKKGLHSGNVVDNA